MLEELRSSPASAKASAIEKGVPTIEVAFINLIDNVLGVLLGPDALILAWCEIT